MATTPQPKHYKIEDPLLEPFYIVIQSNQMVLHKRKSGKQLKDIEWGFFTKMPFLINEIVYQQMLDKNDRKTLGLNEFLDRYNEITEALVDVTRGVRV